MIAWPTSVETWYLILLLGICKTAGEQSETIVAFRLRYELISVAYVRNHRNNGTPPGSRFPEPSRELSPASPDIPHRLPHAG